MRAPLLVDAVIVAAGVIDQKDSSVSHIDFFFPFLYLFLKR